MATIDLGKIKLVWRGTYSSSNTYAVDDLVAYTDSGIVSTYIAIAASSSSNQQVPSTSGTATANYWEYVAKGTTDPIPTQNSGTNGKFLTSNGSSASWATLTGNTPAAYSNMTSDSAGNLSSYTWYTLGGSNLPMTEVFDTDSAVSNGIFTVPSGGAGTYMVHIFTSHSGNSTHGSSDGTMHRLQKSTDSGSNWAVTPSNGVYKALFEGHPGHEQSAAFTTHIAYNLSVGDKLRSQVWVYRNVGQTSIQFAAGDTDGSYSGSTAGTYFIIYRIF